MNVKNAMALKERLDKYMTQLQAIYDEAWENNTNGQGNELSRMVLDHISPIMQTIARLAVQAELLSEQRIIIPTPEGMLVAFPDGGEDYPGITVELERENAPTVRLAMIEHTSSESAYGYDPLHPDEMDRERGEVPDSLLEDDGQSVKPCMVCRAWPQPYLSDELHNRTFYEMDGCPGK